MCNKKSLKVFITHYNIANESKESANQTNGCRELNPSLIII